MNERHVAPVPLAASLGLALMLGGYLLATSTVTFTEKFYVYDVKRILELCAFPLIFALVLLHPTLRDAFHKLAQGIPRWMGAALVGIVGLGVVSSVLSSHSTMALLYSLAEVCMLSLLVVAVLCLAACRRVTGQVIDQIVVVVLAMTGLAVGLQELLGVLAAWSAGLEFHPRIALMHFSWPRFYNDVQAWSIPVIAALPLLFPGKSLAKVLCVVALILEWYVLIATGARGAMLGVGVALSAGILFLPRIRKTLVCYQLAGLIGGILVYGLVVAGHQQLAGVATNDSVAVTSQDSQGENATRDMSAELQAIGDSSGKFLEPVTGNRVWTSSGRMDMWRGSWQDTMAHPLLGIGPMNYACLGPVNRAGHPHNFPLQFMSEWGLPAFLLLGAIMAYLTLRLIPLLRTTDESIFANSQLAGFFATGIVAAAINSCFSGVFMGPASQMTGVLVSGCLLGLLPASQNSSTKKSTGPALLVSALCLSLAFLAFARGELMVAEIRFEQTPIMDQGIPRLWQNGKSCTLYQAAP